MDRTFLREGHLASKNRKKPSKKRSGRSSRSARFERGPQPPLREDRETVDDLVERESRITVRKGEPGPPLQISDNRAEEDAFEGFDSSQYSRDMPPSGNEIGQVKPSRRGLGQSDAVLDRVEKRRKARRAIRNGTQEEMIKPRIEEEEENEEEREEEGEEEEVDGGEVEGHGVRGSHADVLRASEVLNTVDHSMPGRSSSSRQPRHKSGDFGAAYNELYIQLCTRMTNRIYQYFQKLYNRTSGKPSKVKRGLEDIQRWNQAQIDKRCAEIARIHPDTEVYFRYAYAANVMLMSVVIQRDENSEDVEIEVPKFPNFVHRCYIESARVLYDNVHVLDPGLSDRDKLHIRKELFSSFNQAIATSLRMMVPLEAIAPGALQPATVQTTKTETLGAFEDSDDSESESEKEESEEEDGSGDESDEDSGSGSELEEGGASSGAHSEDEEGSEQFSSEGSVGEYSSSGEESDGSQYERVPQRRMLQ